MKRLPWKLSFLKSDVHFKDQIFSLVIKFLAFLFISLFFSMAVVIFLKAWPAFKTFGPSFFVSSTWDSWKQEFGVLALIYGTLLSSLLALLIAVPISIAFALFLNEIAPRWLSVSLGFIVEMLAAIPSIVYGLWGVLVLAPFLRKHVQPFLSYHLGDIPLFSGSYYGIGMMCAGLILAIMIVPTISSLCKEVFRAIPHANKEAVLSLGTTRWEMFKVAIIKGGISGIIGAVVLGFGRAFGETMAVTMVIGNKVDLSLSLFAPSQTMASVLATQYAEADTKLHLSSLTAVGFTLFVVSLLFNGLAIFFLWRMKKNIRV
ncbi:MAG: phosphate ABC transporter permease subunit PstC [Oligoflexia bacterium]|nr:phosphate ABC transporter permease subunit PstC [Oligoflexia bacterium]